jgi:hypothetical protein
MREPAGKVIFACWPISDVYMCKRFQMALKYLYHIVIYIKISNITAYFQLELKENAYIIFVSASIFVCL